MTKIMGLVFVVMPALFTDGLHFSELVWAVNLISPLALGLQGPLGTVAGHEGAPLGAGAWPGKQLCHLRPHLANQAGSPS